MALDPEKISELKEIIHSRLSQMDIHGRIKEVLSENDISYDSDIHEDDLMRILKEKGVLDEVMSQLQFEALRPEDNTPGAPQPRGRPGAREATLTSKGKQVTSAVDPTKRYLFMQVLGGKAFLEHLQEDSPLPGQKSAFFTLHVDFRGQRFQSRPTPCSCEPDIQEGFLLMLHKESSGQAARMADSSTILSIGDPVHITLIKTTPTGESILVSSLFLEWRAVLAAPNSRCTMTVELMGIGSESRVPVGILEIRFEILPAIPQALSEDVVKAHRNLEKNRQAEKERLFLVYAKQWWKEYLQIRPEHKDRLVKIFAQDENGHNRPTCSYVYPMRAGRLLDTPRQAARFVSLIGYEKPQTVGAGEKSEQWTSMHSFLARNKGDCEDHAVLLCSLLLGFGLDAYVCIGTKAKGAAHSWVMVVGLDGIVTFWESLTGHRYVHRPIDLDEGPAAGRPKVPYPYKTIGCVFNHTNFYANCQSTDVVEFCHFALHEDTFWKAMSTDAVSSVVSANIAVSRPILSPSTIDCAEASNTMELQLRLLVSEHRQDQGLSTMWDDHLSYLLTPALSAYETERQCGITAGNEEFQQAIKRAVPDGQTFKGFPIQFVHRNARRAFAACLRSDICEEIVDCRGEHVRHALRVRVYAYPENAVAVWVMFACKYKSIV